MPYTLWSHGRLVGHTDLDIPCVQDHIRQGFIEPTEEGRRILVDATGVPAVMAEGRRGRRDGTKDDDTVMAEFSAACDRREALELELRDEDGARFECDFIRVYDLQDQSLHDDVFDAELDETLEPVSEEERQADDDERAAFERDLAVLLEDVEDKYGSSWSPPDERWETMQYHMVVFLHRAREPWKGGDTLDL